MVADPPVQKDGRCAQCQKVRRRTIPKKSQLPKAARAELERMLTRDPWCSAQCCRLAWGVDVKEQPQKSPGEMGAEDDLPRESIFSLPGKRRDAYLRKDI